MADSGDSDSNSDIPVFKSQKINVSFIYIFILVVKLYFIYFNNIYIGFRLLKVMKKVHVVVPTVKLISVQYVLPD